MSEMAKLEGYRAKNQLDQEETRQKLASLRAAIRELLDPIRPVAELNWNSAADLSMQGVALMAELRMLMREAEAIRQALGK